jgi:hypothetical protein
MLAREEVIKQSRASTADMEIASGRWSEASADEHGTRTLEGGEKESSEAAEFLTTTPELGLKT